MASMAHPERHDIFTYYMSAARGEILKYIIGPMDTSVPQQDADDDRAKLNAGSAKTLWFEKPVN
jgi:hypothetical protein